MKDGNRSRPRWLFGGLMLSMVVIAPIVLAACGGGGEEAAPQVIERTVIVERTVVVPKEVEKIVVATAVPVGEKPWAISAISPDVKYGGLLRLAAHGPPAHWDVHQSATIANEGSQSPMYDNLIRRDPRDVAVPIIPDLAYRWDISSDGLTYTFSLREGVKWHDGTDFTADDVKATYDRIAFPPSGIDSPRQSLFTSLDSINVIDDSTVEFKLANPVSTDFMLASFSTGWNMIFQKKALEDNNFNLREVDNYPGTGPFKYNSRDTEAWLLDKNPDYWNTGLPYVDQIQQVWLKAWSPELAAALLGNLVDWGMWLDPVTWHKVAKTAGMSELRFSTPGRHMIYMRTDQPPFDDVRVRRAIHLITNRQAIKKILADVDEVFINSWFNPLTATGKSKSEVETLPAYRPDKTEDIAEAKRLMAEAGYPGGAGFPKLDFLARESANASLTAQALQASMKEDLNIDSEIRIAQVSVLFQDLAAGDFDIASGGDNAPLLDPAGYIRNWWGKCGDGPCARNFSRWVDDDFDVLLTAFEKELDPAKSLALASQLEDFLEREVPVVPLGYTATLWGWYDYVKGVMPGDFAASYDVFKWDTVWLDK